MEQEHIRSIAHRECRDAVAADRHIVDLEQGRTAVRQVEQALERDCVVEVAAHSQAPLPEKLNNETVKEKLSQLKSDSRNFADLVKASAADSVLSSSLEKLHDEFHTIMEDWYKGSHEHH